MFVRNRDVGLFLDTEGFKTLELENGTHNGQPVYRVAFKFLYMQGVAVFTVAIFSEKEDAEKCYNTIMRVILAKTEADLEGVDGVEYFVAPQRSLAVVHTLDVQNKVKESLLIMPDAKDLNNVVEFKS